MLNFCSLQKLGYFKYVDQRSILNRLATNLPRLHLTKRLHMEGYLTLPTIHDDISAFQPFVEEWEDGHESCLFILGVRVW